MQDKGNIPESPKGWRRVAGAGLLFWILRRAEDEQLEEDRPEVASASGPTKHLRELARNLAREDVEVVRAVEELRGASQGHGNDLLRAAASIRHEGWIDENRIDYEANRLLLMAFGRSTRPLSPDEDERYRAIDTLVTMPIDDAFAELAQLQPALLSFRERCLLAVSDPSLRDASDKDREDRLWTLLLNGLPSLVGPESGQSNTVLRSRIAFGIARVYLAKSMGLRMTE